MNLTPTSSRRQIITAVLLLLALGGGLVRWLPPDSRRAVPLYGGRGP